MLDIGWAELMVIGVVALIVVGPKDLPKLFQALGQWVGRARGLARDFQRAMNDAADESGISDIKKGFDEATNIKSGMGLDGWGDAVKAVKDPIGVKGAVKDTLLGGDDDTGAEPVKAKPKATKKTAPKKPAKSTKSKTASKTAAAAKPAAKKAATKPATKAPAAKKPAKTTTAKKPAAKSTKKAAP